MQSLNITKIAKEAGVSPSTVSRVISKNAKVSEDKRERVEEVIKKYNYRPNALAQGLINAKTNMIGIIAADLVNPYYSTMLESCEKEINRLGYIPMICGTLNDGELEVKYLQKMYDLRMEAVIIIGGKSDNSVSDPDYADMLNRLGENMPIVMTGNVEGSDCYRVMIDEVAAMTQSMEHLIELGHSRIALVGGMGHVKSTYDKRICYRGLLRKHGIAFNSEYVVNSDYSIEGGFEGMEYLFAKNEVLPTAVIAINDYSAVGAMRSIKQKGFQIPSDISLVSFDNTFIVETTIPKLSSISYDYEFFGKKLISTAVALINQETVDNLQKIPPQLVIRDSERKFSE